MWCPSPAARRLAATSPRRGEVGAIGAPPKAGASSDVVRRASRAALSPPGRGQAAVFGGRVRGATQLQMRTGTMPRLLCLLIVAALVGACKPAAPPAPAPPLPTDPF